jgi:hypothetical protein
MIRTFLTVDEALRVDPLDKPLATFGRDDALLYMPPLSATNGPFAELKLTEEAFLEILEWDGEKRTLEDRYMRLTACPMGTGEQHTPR